MDIAPFSRAISIFITGFSPSNYSVDLYLFPGAPVGLGQKVTPLRAASAILNLNICIPANWAGDLSGNRHKKKFQIHFFEV